MRRWNVILTATLLLISLPTFSNGFSQHPDSRTGGRSQDNRDDRGYRNARPPSDFKNGLRDGGRGGQYYDPRHEQDGYDERYRQNNGYYQQRQGGIGPGKGALIGGAGGAVLGAIFGGGLKGTIIGGAAGAGIGSVVGEANQNNRRRNDYNPR
jgi:hypothetical protein